MRAWSLRDPARAEIAENLATGWEALALSIEEIERATERFRDDLDRGVDFRRSERGHGGG
jgi:hypothetical protein